MIYTFIVAALSLLGGWVPLGTRPRHAQLQVYLSLAAGALLGAALFHLLPESSEHIHGSFGLPAVLGVAMVFFLQRYVAPHSHEPHAHDHHGHDHAHHHDDHPAPSGALVPVQPALGSITAIIALCVHSFFDGVAIGAVTGNAGSASDSVTTAVFLSVLVHKPLDGLSVSVLLMSAGVSRRSLWLTQIAYAALVPIGALAFHLTRGAIAEPSAFIGYTLAFSAGTFLAIALTDLLPELHFHTHDRHKLSAALVTGLVVMWLTSLIGHPSHDSHDHATRPAAESHGIDHSDHDH